MRVVFMGTPDFAITPLERLVVNHHEVAAVYTQPDRPSGRGRAPAPSPVKRVAQALGLPVMQPARLRGADIEGELSSFEPDVIVVAAYGQILRKSVLEMPAFGCINIHPSLLPRYRGVSPVPAAILNGDSFTGVSIMLLDEGVDTGPVLSQSQVPVFDRDTTGSLTSKLSLIGAQLLLDILPRLAGGKIVPEPQDEVLATYCHSIKKEDGEIDWGLPAADIWRRVRAYQPWPGSYTRWRGRKLKVLEAFPAGPGAVMEQSAGRVVALNVGGGGLGVATGQGILGLARVQLEGKKVMSADEFLRGQRQGIGMVLPFD